MWLSTRLGCILTDGRLPCLDGLKALALLALMWHRYGRGITYGMQYPLRYSQQIAYPDGLLGHVPRPTGPGVLP